MHHTLTKPTTPRQPVSSLLSASSCVVTTNIITTTTTTSSSPFPLDVLVAYFVALLLCVWTLPFPFHHCHHSIQNLYTCFPIEPTLTLALYIDTRVSTV